MFKIFNQLLCLLIILGSFAQINTVSAVTTAPCTQFLDLTYGYTFNNIYYDAGTNSSLPNGVQAIFLTFQEKNQGGLPDGTYRFGSGGHAYSPEANASGGKLEIGFDNSVDKSVLKKGSHSGNLQVKDGQGKFVDKCVGINYTVGSSWTDKDCRLEFNPNPPPINQKIDVYVKHAPSDEYKISYIGINSSQNFVDKSKPYSKSVKVDADGDSINNMGEKAPFSFWTNSTPKNGAEISLYYEIPGSSPIFFCTTKFDINPVQSKNPTCSVHPSDLDFTKAVSVSAKNLDSPATYKASITNNVTGAVVANSGDYTTNDGTLNILSISPPTLQEGDYKAQITKTGEDTATCTTAAFYVKGPSDTTLPPIGNKKCGDTKDEVCTKTGLDSSCDTGGIKTAIGCIHTNPPEFAKDLLTFLVGIGGGLAFLMMLLGAFQMITSSGNPDTLKAGRERLTSAVIGLLFIIFSILFLKIIGVDILNIPGF